MPIYEYYCPDNHTIYQFYAKTLAQGRTIPRNPDNPSFRMEKKFSTFAVTRGGNVSDSSDIPAAPASAGAADDPKMEAAMHAMEREFSSVDENDPRAMGRMMRRMAELSGERIGGEMEEVVRKLEEGADPDSLEEQLGGTDLPGDGMDDAGAGPAGLVNATDAASPGRAKFRVRRDAPVRDPKLYDYE